ncbi:hypothetical protein [Paraburkholderia heleia]|uniref:hypothetical protein n=1 Tax=Paraburkholderia heleia TaxID=634127 RepID=UPI002AB6358E|nr:hypothetical protein [Paraburkholderia heleia]
MQEPAIFRIVDGAGQVHHSRLTSAQCDAFMSLMLAGGQLPGLRSERMDATAEVDVPPSTGLTLPVPTAEPLPAIEPGSERASLRAALETRQDATKRLASACQAVDRAKAFHDARKAEHAALTVAHEAEVRHAGSNLAEAFKAGGSVGANRLIDRSALADSETRLATSQAALDQLEAERAAAEAGEKRAETAVRLAIMVVKRADVDAMVSRLRTVKAEYMTLASAIDGARFSDVPVTQDAMEAMRIETPHAGHIDAASKRWHAYTAALREDPQTAWEDMQ